jgi:G3E family GTPase
MHELLNKYYDYILLETIDAADSLPIVKMFWLDEGLHGDLILDGIEK